jgi:hypothetical protein
MDNLGLFLNSDFFLIPTNPDPFSIMALQTLTSILPRWSNWKIGNEATFADSAYPLRTGLPKFVGTIIQRFNVRRGRAAAPYRDNIAEIKTVTKERLFPALKAAGLTLPDATYTKTIRDDGDCLVEIPDFGALLPRSQDAGVPVFAVEDSELNYSGPVLENAIDKREQLRHQFDAVATTLRGLMG